MTESENFFRTSPKFPWMKCLKDKVYGFYSGPTMGLVSIYLFDRFGNPIFKCEWIFDNYIINFTEYIQYDTNREEWFWEEYLDLMFGYPRKSPLDPLDVVDVSKFPEPNSIPARGLFQTFEMIREDVKFFRARDRFKIKKYIYHLVLCTRVSSNADRGKNILPHLPLEMIFHLLTFLRFLDFGDQKDKVKSLD